jgi:hypothetical protein
MKNLQVLRLARLELLGKSLGMALALILGKETENMKKGKRTVYCVYSRYENSQFCGCFPTDILAEAECRRREALPGGRTCWYDEREVNRQELQQILEDDVTEEQFKKGTWI